MTSRRYLTHDCDIQQVELLVQPGENGDWYISIVPAGHKTARLVTGEGACVRVTTSGERPEHSAVAAAVYALYRALGNEAEE